MPASGAAAGFGLGSVGRAALLAAPLAVLIPHFERFAPQDASGAADPARGIRQFVVGTCGRHLRPVGAPEPNSEARDATTYGVLLPRLHPGRYEWRLARAAGGTFTDAGSARCH
jgi:hypothetical protein